MNNLDDVFNSELDEKEAEMMLATNDYERANERISKVHN
jgi:hypothetical protein